MDYTEMDYAELFRQVLAGDQGAADEFYRRLAPVIKAMIGRMLRESEARRAVDPWDILQTALRRLLEEGIVPDEPEAWLYTTARNRLLGIMTRHDITRVQTGGDVVADTQAGRELSPEEQAEAADEQKEAARIVEQLRQLLLPAVMASFELRAEGGTWALATERYAPRDKTVEAWRRQCKRAVERALGGQRLL